MTTYTIQGFSRVLDYATGTYSGFGTAELKLVRPDAATTMVHHYMTLDEDMSLVGMTRVHDFASASVTVGTIGGSTHELQGGYSHMERFVYALDWGAGNMTYIHAFFQPMSGEEFIFGMTGTPLPAATTLEELNSLMAGARHWVLDGPMESGEDIALTSFQNLTRTQNDQVTARDGQALYWDGGLGADTLTGGALDDTLLGGAGNDRLLAGDGANTILGGAGADVIVTTTASLYNDLMGGAGNDTISSVGIHGGNSSGGSGDDRIVLGGGALTGGYWSASHHANGGSGQDTIIGAQAGDYMMGDAGNDSLLGYGGQDQLNGGRGDDTLDGGAASDMLIGGIGNDQITGGAGQDFLVGGLGQDSLNGGTGEGDTFVFNLAGESGPVGSDVIIGFETGLDRIELTGLDANATLDGDQGFAWRGTAGFTAIGQLRISVVGGDTIVLGNTEGNSAAEFRLILQGVTGITAADFLL